MTNGHHFSEYQEKWTTLRGIPKFSEISHREFPIHLTFLPVVFFLEFSVEWYVLQQFPDFLETLDLCLEIFEIFGRMESVLMMS